MLCEFSNIYHSSRSRAIGHVFNKVGAFEYRAACVVNHQLLSNAEFRVLLVPVIVMFTNFHHDIFSSNKKNSKRCAFEATL